MAKLECHSTAWWTSAFEVGPGAWMEWSKYTAMLKFSGLLCRGEGAFGGLLQGALMLFISRPHDNELVGRDQFRAKKVKCLLSQQKVGESAEKPKMSSTDHDDYCLKDYKYRYQPDLLQGKVAFITGGGSGIGFRIAELFMRHGCDTVIASRRLGKVEEVCMPF